MAIPHPETFAGEICVPFTFLSPAQQELFSARLAERELVAIREYFDGQLNPWRDLRQQIKSLKREPLTSATLRQMKRLLKRYRELEWHRCQWEKRQHRQQQLAQAHAWQTVAQESLPTASQQWGNWQRHQAVAHWPSRAVWHYADQILPFFQQYLRQAQQEYQQKESQCDVFVQHRIQRFLTELAQWIDQQQQQVCWAILARLRLIGMLGDVTRDDLMSETTCPGDVAVQNKAMCQMPSTMTIELFQAFNHYLFHHRPQWRDEMRQLPWLHAHPNWFFSMAANHWQIIPRTLQAYVMPTTRWWHRWVFVKTKRVAEWLRHAQGLFIYMRLMPTLVGCEPSCTTAAAEWQLPQLQHQYQSTEQWLRQLARLVPHRWNWFYRRLRTQLIVLQKQIRVHQQQNILYQSERLQVLIDTMATLPSTKMESLIGQLNQLKQWVATDPQWRRLYRTCQDQLAQIDTWQRCQQQQTQQAQWEQTLTAVTQQYTHEQAIQLAEHFLQLDAMTQLRASQAVTPVMRQLWQEFKQIHQQLNQQMVTDASTCSDEWSTMQMARLECLLCLFEQLKLPDLLSQIEEHFTEVLWRVCQNVCLPLDQQRNVGWRTFQLQLIGGAPVPWVATQARQLLALEQKNFGHFRARHQALRMEIIARKVVKQPQDFLQQLTKQIAQALRQQLNFSTRQQHAFERCCLRIEQGDTVAQVMANKPCCFSWEKQHGLAKQLLTVWATARQQLFQQQHIDAQHGESFRSATRCVKQLQGEIAKWLPQFNLFAHHAERAMDAKSETMAAMNPSKETVATADSAKPSRRQQLVAKFRRRR